MKFVGHLDMMRYFQKAIRRAEIDIAFSEGYSPHMIMSFASPLGVGVTSDSEYFDIELRTGISSKEALIKLNKVMVEGMKVLSFRKIAEDKKNNAMALIAAADYTICFRTGSISVKDWIGKVDTFYQQESITILKKTKRSEKEVDIKPFIYKIWTEGEQLKMQLAAGSVNNLKPDLVVEAFTKYLGISLPPFSLFINRDEIYADLGSEDERKLISLEDLGEEIAE
jgi:radical SAM-linked protein